MHRRHCRRTSHCYDGGCVFLARLLVLIPNTDNSLQIDHSPEMPVSVWSSVQSHHSLILILPKAEKARIEKAGHDVRRETILQHGKRSFVHRVDGDLVRRHLFRFLSFSLPFTRSLDVCDNVSRPLHVRLAIISTKTVSTLRRLSRR